MIVVEYTFLYACVEGGCFYGVWYIVVVFSFGLSFGFFVFGFGFSFGFWVVGVIT